MSNLTQQDKQDLIEAVVLSSNHPTDSAKAMVEARSHQEEVLRFLSDTRNGLGFVGATWNDVEEIYANFLKYPMITNVKAHLASGMKMNIVSDVDTVDELIQLITDSYGEWDKIEYNEQVVAVDQKLPKTINP